MCRLLMRKSIEISNRTDASYSQVQFSPFKVFYPVPTTIHNVALHRGYLVVIILCRS